MQENIMERTKEEKYLERIFYLLRTHDNIRFTGKKARFNQTELRLLGEIVSAKNKGQRYISTQLATMLGVTRSAISQIVNNLEERGVVKRVPDEVDRKIAYVEITDNVLDVYGEELHGISARVAKVISMFGEERFDELCDRLDEFFKIAEKVMKEDDK